MWEPSEISGWALRSQGRTCQGRAVECWPETVSVQGSLSFCLENLPVCGMNDICTEEFVLQARPYSEHSQGWLHSLCLARLAPGIKTTKAVSLISIASLHYLFIHVLAHRVGGLNCVYCLFLLVLTLRLKLFSQRQLSTCEILLS